MRVATNLVVVMLTTATWAASQEVPVIGPGHIDLITDRLQPFEAEYTQSGFPFRTRLTRTGTPRPMLSFQMVMEGPTGVGIDHVGHYADDLSFAYRRFGFRGFGPEYIDASADSTRLRLRRITLKDDEDATATDWSTPLDNGVFDGTFAYWLIAALPLSDGYAWQLRTWSVRKDSAEVRTTPTFTVVGRETLTVDGISWDCRVVSVVSRGAEFRMWVTDRAPYLVQQFAGREGDELSPVIQLVRVLAPSG